MSDFYRRDGTPYANAVEWSKDFGIVENKIVKQEELPNGYFVSTVWLGLNHNYGEGKPLIFETMVFPEKGNYSDIYMERYSTEQEAIEGHNRLVEKWKNITEGK